MNTNYLKIRSTDQGHIIIVDRASPSTKSLQIKTWEDGFQSYEKEGSRWVKTLFPPEINLFGETEPSEVINQFIENVPNKIKEQICGIRFRQMGTALVE